MAYPTSANVKVAQQSIQIARDEQSRQSSGSVHNRSQFTLSQIASHLCNIIDHLFPEKNVKKALVIRGPHPETSEKVRGRRYPRICE